MSPGTAKTLSVVLANYNHARFLPESLGAMVGQSRPPDELIVVDDASTDDSVAVIERFAARYPFVRLLRNERNLGVFASGRRGLEAATGDYVSFPASDDRVLPGFYERTMELLERHPDARVCCSLSNLMDERGGDLGPYHTQVVRPTAGFVPPREALAAYRYGNWIVPNTVVYRRDVLSELGGFRLELGPSADGFMCQLIAARYGACFIPERLACWRKMESGYASSYTADVDRTLRLIARLSELMRTEHAGVFPPGFAAEQERVAIASTVQALSERTPVPYDRIAGLRRQLSAPALRDRLYFALVRAFPFMGRALTRAFVFSYIDPGNRRRILRGKLRRAVGLS